MLVGRRLLNTRFKISLQKSQSQDLPEIFLIQDRLRSLRLPNTSKKQSPMPTLSTPFLIFSNSEMLKYAVGRKFYLSTVTARRHKHRKSIGYRNNIRRAQIPKFPASSSNFNGMIGRQPWSGSYWRRPVFHRSWVWMPAPDIFHMIFC